MKKIFSLLGITLFLIGCTTTNSHQTNSEIIIFAASSLTNVFMELADEFETRHPDTEVVLNFASSSQLAAQITEGAQADIFASANQIQMGNIVDAGLLQGQPQIFAHNGLAILVPMENPAQINSLADLANPKLTLILAAPATPIRTYSDQVIQNYANEAYTQAVYANLASEEANVRQVVTKIALGEGDVGLAYTSDLTPDIREYVASIPIPPENNITAKYPIAILNSSHNSELANLFVSFVLSDAGQEILSAWGFLPAKNVQD